MDNLTKPAKNTTAETQPAIVVRNVDMIFNIANEQLNSLKEYFISLVRGKLFFREFKALENISFTVERGDVYGIVGTNGSGKSTLLKVIAGVLEPTHGSCTINGSIAPLIELGAGFDPELTARENVYLNGSLLGYSKKFIDEQFDSIVSFAEVGKFIDMPLKNYSSGMVARIAFAIATATTPDILVVDEALSVGDFMFQEKCERRIKDLVEQHGTTLLFVSHSIDQVERVCKKALWIEKGQKRMEGPVEEVCYVYRNLEYTDFVSANNIMNLSAATIDDLRASITVQNIIEALWRCAGAPDAENAVAWALQAEIVTCDINLSARASRQNLADLLYCYAAWRKPSACSVEDIERKRFAFVDDLPEDAAARTHIEWCLAYGILTPLENENGSAELALDKQARCIDFAKAVTRMYKRAFSYPDDVKPSEPYVLSGHYDAVLDQGIMAKYDNGNFGPNDAVTRGDAVATIWRIANRPQANPAPSYADVFETEYFGQAIAWAEKTGISTIGQGAKFLPNDPITIQDIVLLFRRYIALATETPIPAATSTQFKGHRAATPEHAEALQWCLTHKMFEDTPNCFDDTFDLEKSAPRSMMVTLSAVAQRIVQGTER